MWRFTEAAIDTVQAWMKWRVDELLKHRTRGVRISRPEAKPLPEESATTTRRSENTFYWWVGDREARGICIHWNLRGNSSVKPSWDWLLLDPPWNATSSSLEPHPGKCFCSLKNFFYFYFTLWTSAWCRKLKSWKQGSNQKQRELHQWTETCVLHSSSSENEVWTSSLASVLQLSRGFQKPPEKMAPQYFTQ